MKRISVLLVFLTLFPLFLLCQESEKPFTVDVSADIVSRYVWRGVNLSESPSIQPVLGLSYKNLTLGSWGSFSFSRETLQEIDLFLSYERDFFSLTLNNYYNTLDTLGFKGNYFNLANASTPHILEGVISVNGPETFPLSFSIATMFYGNDRDENGDNCFSTYMELNYPFAINEVETGIFIGVTPTKGYYADGFGVVNLGFSATKSIKITDTFSLPVTGSFMLNPKQEKVFFVFSITL